MADSVHRGVGEKLNRGLVAVRSAEGVYLSWRLLPGDPAGLAFNVYRQEEGAPALRINAEPATPTTDCLDRSAQARKTYRHLVKSLPGGAEKDEATLPHDPTTARLASQVDSGFPARRGRILESVCGTAVWTVLLRI